MDDRGVIHDDLTSPVMPLPLLRSRTRRRRQRPPQWTTTAPAALLGWWLAAAPATMTTAATTATAQSPTVVVDSGFVFDGTHSDLAQQFYRRHTATSASSSASSAVATIALPSPAIGAVTGRLQADLGASHLRFDQLSPLLQRALLWDLGYVEVAAQDGPSRGWAQVRVKCGFRMAELAISRATLERTGCSPRTCEKAPSGVLYHQLADDVASNGTCGAVAVGSASRCATEMPQATMSMGLQVRNDSVVWGDGGDDDVLPETELVRHVWRNVSSSSSSSSSSLFSSGSLSASSSSASSAASSSSSRSLSVSSALPANSDAIFAIHLKHERPSTQSPCRVPSLVIPCVEYRPRDQDQWCLPEPGRLVTQWLRAEMASKAERTATSALSGSNRPWLAYGLPVGLGVLAAVAVIGAIGAVLYRRRAQRHRRKSPAPADDVSYFFTEHDRRDDDEGGAGGGRYSTTPVLGGGSDKFSGSMPAPARLSRSRPPPRRMSRSSAAGVHKPTVENVRHSLDGDDRRSSAHSLGDNGGDPLARSGGTVHGSEATTYTGSSTGDLESLRSMMRMTGGTPSSFSSSSHSLRILPPERPSSPPSGLLAELLADPEVMRRRVPVVDLSLHRLLVSSRRGEIWLGRFRDRPVAVKRLASDRRSSLQDLGVCVAEIRILAQLNHRNLVSLVAVAWNTPESICMAMEYMAQGSLRQLLDARKPPSREDPTFTWTPPAPRQGAHATQEEPSGVKTRVALDVARGLSYLHDLRPTMTHRDVRTKHVLLDVNFQAKLCDFGITRTNGGDAVTASIGNALWTAPEVMAGGRYTERADIYSFGVLLTELDTHREPFHDVVDEKTGERVQSIRFIHLISLGELKPSLSANCPKGIQKLAQDCLHVDPAQRPTAEVVIQRLMAIDDVTAADGDNAIHDDFTGSRVHIVASTDGVRKGSVPSGTNDMHSRVDVTISRPWPNRTSSSMSIEPSPAAVEPRPVADAASFIRPRLEFDAGTAVLSPQFSFSLRSDSEVSSGYPNLTQSRRRVSSAISIAPTGSLDVPVMDPLKENSGVKKEDLNEDDDADDDDMEFEIEDLHRQTDAQHSSHLHEDTNNDGNSNDHDLCHDTNVTFGDTEDTDDVHDYDHDEILGLDMETPSWEWRHRTSSAISIEPSFVSIPLLDASKASYERGQIALEFEDYYQEDSMVIMAARDSNDPEPGRSLSYYSDDGESEWV